MIADTLVYFFMGLVVGSLVVGSLMPWRKGLGSAMKTPAKPVKVTKPKNQKRVEAGKKAAEKRKLKALDKAIAVEKEAREVQEPRFGSLGQTATATIDTSVPTMNSKVHIVPENVTVMSAGKGNGEASWDR